MSAGRQPAAEETLGSLEVVHLFDGAMPTGVSVSICRVTGDVTAAEALGDRVTTPVSSSAAQRNPASIRAKPEPFRTVGSTMRTLPCAAPKSTTACGEPAPTSTAFPSASMDTD